MIWKGPSHTPARCVAATVPRLNVTPHTAVRGHPSYTPKFNSPTVALTVTTHRRRDEPTRTPEPSESEHAGHVVASERTGVRTWTGLRYRWTFPTPKPGAYLAYRRKVQDHVDGMVHGIVPS